MLQSDPQTTMSRISLAIIATVVIAVGSALDCNAQKETKIFVSFEQFAQRFVFMNPSERFCKQIYT
jgi:hypothetical protein